MKWLRKFTLLPLCLTLSILTAFLMFLHRISTTILYCFMLIFLLGSFACFLGAEYHSGWIGLVLAFVISPYGLPMMNATLISLLQNFNDKLKNS